MVRYDWVCHACRATNRSGVEKCAVCGCSAFATIDEINRLSPTRQRAVTFEIDPWLLAAVVGNLGLYFLFDYSSKLAALLFPVAFIVTGVAIVKGWKRFLGSS